ncbi:MAG: DNA polymerase III subunit delta [Muribaculaceae bacterium]|nr:DNA polymerase III subunit delta [Muribaculaceae bacterium]
MAQPAFRDLLAEIKKGKTLSPIYILMGEETYYIDELVEAFENNIIPEEDKDFNYHIFYGNDVDMEIMIATAQQFPVMADRKLVILKEAQTLNQAKVQLEKLAPYMSHPSPQTVFVLAYKGDNLSSTSKLMKSVAASKGVVFKSEPVKEWQLPGHVKDYCAGMKFSIEEKALNLLCEYIGTPLSKIFGEVNKLVMIKGDDRKITAKDVEQHIGVSKDFNNFELVRAVASKNYSQSMKIIQYFERNPKTNPTILTNSMLFAFFQKLAITHYLADKSEKGMLDGLGLKSAWQLKEVKEGIRFYNPRQAINSIHYIREFDTKSKGIESYQNEYDLLKELIFKIITN